VTHLGYYRTEEEAARVYDKVSISLHGDTAQTNFPIDQVGVLTSTCLGDRGLKQCSAISFVLGTKGACGNGAALKDNMYVGHWSLVLW
jgi:hypothetical protein